ncbi:MAG: AraC family transcriptional regulator [Cyanobacteria bacterium P01_A01_bin.116]
MNHTSLLEGIPAVCLNATDIPSEHRLDVLKQTTAPLFDVLPTEKTRPFSYSITSYLVQHLTFTQASFDEMQMTRTSRHLSRHRPDCITLSYFPAGSMQGTLESGAPLQMANDVISIQDFAYPFEGVGQSDGFMSVTIPRHAIAIYDQIYKRYPMFSWPITSPAGRVLTQAWLTLWETLPNISQTDAPAIAQGFIGLLNGLLSGLPNGLLPAQENMAAQVASATEDAMKAYLRDNLHQPNVSVNNLCEVFHCSRASVYRLFKAEGGVHAYVRKQRLTRCYQSLSELPPSSRKTISDIANSWGFMDAASFSRLFRKQYGLSPSDVGADSDKTVNLVLDTKASYWCQSERLRQWLDK